ncbi:MAG TPA: hypothetical protein PK360_14020, partial [bacterium]|nr:hypothetical protein [bacterium]
MKSRVCFWGMVGLLAAAIFSSCSQPDHPAPRTVSVDTGTDFILRFEENRYTAAKPELARVDTAVIQGIRHWGIFEHAPNRLEFPDVYIGPDARLEFAIGILEGAWKNSGDGVRFQISARQSGRPPQVCYSRYIDPKRDENHRAWLSGEAVISGIQNATATLIFETFPGENPGDTDNDSDWAFWA